MQDLNDLFYFSQVITHGGFAAAGRALNTPKSTLSRRVAQLEERLGARLIERSSRRFRVTEIGQTFFVHAQAALAAAERAEAAVASSLSEPRGVVRCACPTGLVELITPMMIDFLKLYPKVFVQIIALDRAVDLIKERIDVAVRVRTKLDSDVALTMRTLGRSRRILVASPALANTFGSRDITRLAELPTLSTSSNDEEATWILEGPEGRTIRHTHAPRLGCGDFYAVREAALSGLGIALLPDHACADALDTGALVRVHPEWSGEDGIIHLVFTTRVGLPPLTRAWIDQLAAGFRAIAAKA